MRIKTLKIVKDKLMLIREFYLSPLLFFLFIMSVFRDLPDSIILKFFAVP